MIETSNSADPPSSSSNGISPRWSLATVLFATTMVCLLCGIFLKMRVYYIWINCGPFGFVVVTSGVVLTVIGIGMLFADRKPARFLRFGAFSLLPIVAGLAGTWLGQKLNRDGFEIVVQSTDDPAQIEIAEMQLASGMVVSWFPTQAGLAFGLMIAAIAAFGYFRARQRHNTPMASSFTDDVMNET